MFETTTSSIMSALSLLGYSETLEENLLTKIEELVCRVYSPKSDIKTISELRWAMFKKNQTTSEGLPPTRNALRLAVSRANYQCIIWANDTVPKHFFNRCTDIKFCYSQVFSLYFSTKIIVVCTRDCYTILNCLKCIYLMLAIKV